MASWLDGLTSGSAIPALERGIAFSAARHRLILENVANADTPNYRRKDLDVGAFQEALLATGGAGPRTFRAAAGGSAPADAHGAGVLRHDGNDVNVEMELALLSQNVGYHNRLAALLKKSFDQIRMAISERNSA
jgi:flagellar basal-body rod protein FlgB